jgi:hypothetical protein
MSDTRNVMYIKKAEDTGWAIPSHVCIAGNYSLERFLAELQKQIDTKNEKSHSDYLWKVAADRWGDDGQLIEECDRWHLKRYEVCTTPAESQYQAVVILYYEPAAVLATLA